MVPTSVNSKLHTFTSPKFRSVVNEAINFFLKTPVQTLPPVEKFGGCGVYALFYQGPNKHYEKIARRNKKTCALPIYVGKAVPSGWRTARGTTSDTGTLFRRLCEHASSIKKTNDLEARDFLCRFMILSGTESDLVVPVEAELIRRLKPVWNTTIDGFGNHDPGAGRYDQARSEWDVLHHGRSWAKRLRGKSVPIKNVIKKLHKSLS